MRCSMMRAQHKSNDGYIPRYGQSGCVVYESFIFLLFLFCVVDNLQFMELVRSCPFFHSAVIVQFVIVSELIHLWVF